MTPQDWRDMASVFRAGATRASQWSHNADRQQEAEVLRAQAGRCDQIAQEREASESAGT